MIARLTAALAPVALLLALLGAPPAWAAAAAPTAAAPSAVELQSLVATLQSEQARTALVGQLQALIAAQRGTAPAVPAAAPPADLVAGLTQRLNAAAGELLAGFAVVVDAPRFLAWAREQVSDPVARALWRSVLFAVTLVFGLGVAAEAVIRFALRGLRHRVEPSRGDRRWLQIVLGVTGIIVALLPVGGFAGGALLGMALALPQLSPGRDAIALLLQATIAARLILAGASALLTPPSGWPSLLPAGEENRTYLLIWIRRYTILGVFGYGIAGAAWWLGAPGAIYALILKLVVLGLALLAVVFILQNRAAVGSWIAAGARPEAGGWTRLRRRAGEVWHVPAILYIAFLYLAYALHDERGTGYVLSATAMSLAAIVAARLAAHAIDRLTRRGFALSDEQKQRFPLLEERANRYLPILDWGATTAAYALALLIVLEAWDVGSFEWFASGPGRRVSGGVLSALLVLAVAVAAWELVAAAIERNLAALNHDGAPGRIRRRTLLPLLRTATACVIIVIASLVILSQLGVNIAPLLAGAGVVGVAVGFGSQALVKDIITGLFILAEDQIAVGDIADVGKDHAGVVEAITIRTIRLRDQAGTVITVPFSEVTTVKNLTKDYAFAVARITIGYGEDIDRVVEILRAACDELAEDAELGPLIIDRFDYQGVDSLNEFSVVLLLRVRTLPGKQWTVGRALNRLVKIRLAEQRVAGRDPSPIVLSGVLPAAAGAAGAEHGDGRRRMA